MLCARDTNVMCQDTGPSEQSFGIQFDTWHCSCPRCLLQFGVYPPVASATQSFECSSVDDDDDDEDDDD